MTGRDFQPASICPSCHGKTHRGKHATLHKQGYQPISVARLVASVRSAGLHITQDGDCYAWQIGDLSGGVSNVLDALGSALHSLLMERMEVQA